MAKDKKKLIQIICPRCESFLAYVPVDSDVYCPKCQRWIYLGGGDSKQKVEAVKS